MASNSTPEQKKIHFLHIGKTGGTALKNVFHKHNMTSKYEIVTYLHHITLKNIPEGEKVIFCLRDPVSRFVSGFYSRQRRGRPLNNYEWSAKERVAFELFPTVNDLGMALADSSCDSHEAAKAALNNIYHVSSSYYDWFISDDYFLSRWQDVLYIGFQENLNHDFAKLKQILALPDVAELPTDAVEAHRNPPEVDRSLAKEAEAALKDWYAKEYHFYDLCKRKISGR